MPTPNPSVLKDLRLDHIRFYVRSIETTRDWLVDGYGLAVRAASGDGSGVRSVELGANDVRILVSEPVSGDHPGAAYVERHGDGVADIAFGVPDARAAFDEAVRRGARVVAEPELADGLVTASIGGFGDVVHTFVERRDGTAGALAPGLRPTPRSVSGPDCHLRTIDHFAICVVPGDIDQTVAFYRYVLDFELTFTERLQIGNQAMTTKVVQSRSGDVTLTLIEPDVTQEPGHINEFLTEHGCAGVQHIAFSTEDIVSAVDEIRRRGVAFMGTPDSYYKGLLDRVVPARYSVDELHHHEILVDEDHDGQLYQIFTKSVHPRNTIFLELIERMGARTFGSGNITALYQAAERQRRPGSESRAA